MVESTGALAVVPTDGGAGAAVVMVGAITQGNSMRAGGNVEFVMATGATGEYEAQSEPHWNKPE